jgi:hypothetical protein
MPWINSTLETDLPRLRLDSLFVLQRFKLQRMVELSTEETIINTVGHTTVDLIYVVHIFFLLLFKCRFFC